MLQPDEGRFYDGGSLDGTVPPGGPDLSVRLLRDVTGDPPRESFLLERRIAYRARWGAGDLDIVVPTPSAESAQTFRTDLTSVPDLFTWLVPRTGCHLPAALIHDGLIYDEGEPASYVAAEDVSRVEADRIFRDAMADLGTGLIRRWLMWAAVSIATVAAGVTDVAPASQTTTTEEMPPAAKSPGDKRKDRAYRIGVFGSLAVIVVLGAIATLDVLDLWDVLPWMGDRGTLAELGLGATAAVLIPAVLSLGWGRLWKAGLIAGWALAGLLHVTLFLVALTGVYQALEWLGRHLGHRPEEPAPGGELGVQA